MSRITLRVLPHNFASGPPFPVDNGWRPGDAVIYETDPSGADVTAAAMPGKGGMRMVVYNREDFPVVVDLESSV